MGPIGFPETSVITTLRRVMSQKNAELNSELKCHIPEDMNHQQCPSEYFNTSEERSIDRSRNQPILTEM